MVKAAWIGFNARYPYQWLMTQTDVDAVRRIWDTETPRFSLQAMWDTHWILVTEHNPPYDVLADLYQRTLDEPHNKVLIDYFTRFNAMPPEIEEHVRCNSNFNALV